MDLKQEDMFVWIRLVLFKTGPMVESSNQGNKPDLKFCDWTWNRTKLV